MNVTIQYKEKNINMNLTARFAKLYAVPHSYSEDGLALEEWGTGELESVPACKIGDETLLASFVVENGSVGVVYLGEGVTYAAH